MADIARRLERIEKALGEADCGCSAPGNQLRMVVVEDDWTDERKLAAENVVRFDCPTHGRTKPIIVHLSPTDARL